MAGTEVTEMTRDECEAVLRRNGIGRLAMVDGERPYLVPIAFAYARDAIYGHTPAGRKLAVLRRSPEVALLVDEIEDLGEWRSVLVEGRWSELTAPAAQDNARLIILNAFDNPWWATAGHGHATSLADAVIYRIDIETLTGRRQQA